LHFYQPALTAILLDSLPPEKRGGGMMLTAVLPQVPWLFLPPVGATSWIISACWECASRLLSRGLYQYL